MKLTFKTFFKEKKCWKGYVKRGMKKKGNRYVNNCVKENSLLDRVVLSVVEPIEIEGVGSTQAKVDSGNEAYNVVHGMNLKISNNNVTFNTINGKMITLPIVDTIVIHIGSGVKEERPIVSLNIKLKDKHYQDVPFSIADRSENEESVLIGEPFIREIGALIDVSLSGV